MTACFLFFGILIGIIGRLPEKDLVDTFIDGARDMLGVALIIGVARGITVIMNNGLITDTVLYWAEQAVSGLSSVAFIIVIYLLYLPLSFLIPSSSGPGDGLHADHGAAGPVRRRAQLPDRDRLPDRQRPGQPGHPHFSSRDGRPGHRPGGLRHLVAVRLACYCCCWLCSASCSPSVIGLVVW